MSDLIDRQTALKKIGQINGILLFNGAILINYLDAEKAIEDLPSAQPEQHERVFKGIVVEYPTYNTYPEYEGKPYFSIKYTENGQEFIGYGTYKPEVLSEYLKEYFLPSAQPEGWLEQNKDKILQAGMEGREFDFRIGGRLFAIREKAQ